MKIYRDINGLHIDGKTWAIQITTNYRRRWLSMGSAYDDVTFSVGATSVRFCDTVVCPRLYRWLARRHHKRSLT